MSNKPEKVFKAGAVRASIFRNHITQNGRQIPLPKVILEVRYRDKNGEWRGTNSLSLNEVPKAVLALQKAFEYLMEHKEPDTTVSDDKTPNDEEEVTRKRDEAMKYGAPVERFK
jgi:hypothetical protein